MSVLRVLHLVGSAVSDFYCDLPWLMSRLGLAIDSPYLTSELLWKATTSIGRTRDGLQRAAAPRPIGECFFMNDLTRSELDKALLVHREICQGYPRRGDGEDMYLWSEKAGNLSTN